MSDGTLVVPRAETSVQDPWAVPPGCSAVTLLRATDGSVPPLRTTVAAWFDEERLTFVFAGEDRGVVATHLVHDAPLYEEDVVEVFLSPGDRREYFEIEVNPLGTTFDARVSSPDGVRATMTVDRSWECEGLFAAVRRTPDRLEVVVRIPFAALGTSAPPPGSRWRGNLYRIDRDSARGHEFLAWRPTMKTPPDFHVAGAFGTLEFSGPASR